MIMKRYDYNEKTVRKGKVIEQEACFLKSLISLILLLVSYLLASIWTRSVITNMYMNKEQVIWTYTWKSVFFDKYACKSN